MASIGQRGKWAEDQVRSWMKKRSDADARFAFNRYPDARAGSLQSAPSDFEASCRGTHFKVEVKEVKITTVATRRLPQANFSVDKVARMNKWRFAGDQCWVVVCHRGEGRVQEWRLVPLDVFLDTAPSWDVGMFKAYPKVGDVMEQLFGEK
jgi:hypothetical protein